MEVDEEFETKVNVLELLLPDYSQKEQKYVLYGENVQFSSPIEESMSSVSSRRKQTKYLNFVKKYDLKEPRLVLKRLILPVSTIKQEQLNEDENSFNGSPYRDDSWNSSDFPESRNSFNEYSQLGHDIKEETHPDGRLQIKRLHEHSLTKSSDSFDEYSLLGHDIKEETLPDETLHEHSLNVRVLQNKEKLLPQKKLPPRKKLPPLHETPNQCNLCKYVFGVTSSFLDHKKICNESSNICRTILLSVIDEAVSDNKSKETKDDTRPTPFRLVCCNQIFTTFSEFSNHKLSTHNIDMFSCGLCSQTFLGVKMLYKHYSATHFPGLYINLTYIQEDYPSNTEECTAQQQGILCQCPVCTKKLFKETSYKPSVLKPHVCKTCNLSFPFKTRLKKHEKTHLGIKTHPCDICPVSFTSHSSLKYHKKNLHSSEASPFKVTCNICSKELSCKSSLKQHVQSVHSGLDRSRIQFCCPHCPKTFANTKSLPKHIQSHNLRNEEYTCAHCNKIYYCKDYLIYHMKTKHLPKEALELIKCKICGFETNNKTKLSKHKVKNHSELRYSCDRCGKRFAFKDNLEVHQVIHSDEKPFICQVCGKAFKRAGNLEQHQYTHSDERPHLCFVCGQSFRLRTHVKQHMAVHGLGGRQHKCLICNKLFAKRRELKFHMSSHGVP